MHDERQGGGASRPSRLLNHVKQPSTLYKSEDSFMEEGKFFFL
jgi:hypothetical protein